MSSSLTSRRARAHRGVSKRSAWRSSARNFARLREPELRDNPFQRTPGERPSSGAG
jgi:hypothetical protein